MPLRSSASSVRLRAADLAIRQGAGRLLPVGYMFDFQGLPPALESLRRRVGGRYPTIPSLRYRVSDNNTTAHSVKEVSLAAHVHELHLPEDHDGSETGHQMLTRSLPAAPHPSWDVWLIHRGVGIYTLCYRSDHALQDGVAAAYIARKLLDDYPQGGPRAHRPSLPTLRGVGGLIKEIIPRKEFPQRASAFNILPLGEHRLEHVDFSLIQLHSIARTSGGTVNDVYLGALAYAIRQWHRAVTGTDHPSLSANMPMSTRKIGEEYRVLNSVTAARILLPCDEGSADGALKEVIKQTTQLRQSRRRDAARLLSATIPPNVGARAVARKSHSNPVRVWLSHMDFGPRLVHQGQAATHAGLFTDIAEKVLLYTAMTSYDETARLTLVYDMALPSAHEIGDHWLESLHSLSHP